MALWFSIFALRIATDLAIFALPMPVLASLQLPRKQKICLMLVFAVGGCVCLMSFLRLRHIYVLAISKDIPWDNVAAATWSGIEINVGIICACLPTLKHLITYFAPCLLSSTHSHSVSSRTPSNGRIDRISANQSERRKTPDGLSPRPGEVALVAEMDNKQGISGERKGMPDFELEVLSMSTSTSGKDSARNVVG
ncbi:MAG: hypothetical protein M1830_003747 [Pleopsidium flavum]|nr:MAG: hypothetical protein M1830_003747 [Pleopsidium flavum]